jgi:hypothetical protein
VLVTWSSYAAMYGTVAPNGTFALGVVVPYTAQGALAVSARGSAGDYAATLFTVL